MSRDLRDALGHWATGIAVVTTTDENGQDFGMTVNSFASVSLEPALVLWSVQHDCEYRHLFDRGYCVSVLGDAQQDIVWKFTQGTQAERFEGVSIVRSASGLPLIEGAIAHFDCQLHQKIVAGDHDILIGEVTDFASNGNPPVLFNQGQLAAAKPLS